MYYTTLLTHAVIPIWSALHKYEMKKEKNEIETRELKKSQFCVSILAWIEVAPAVNYYRHRNRGTHTKYENRYG